MINIHKDMQKTEKGVLVHWWENRLVIAMENGVDFP